LFDTADENEESESEESSLNGRELQSSTVSEEKKRESVEVSTDKDTTVHEKKHPTKKLKVYTELEYATKKSDEDQPTNVIVKQGPKSYPLTNISEPTNNDCLFGRGGGTNHHPGNKKFRELVDKRKDEYKAAKRLDKSLVAMEIITNWRNQCPPGRFLKFDEVTKLWSDVGDNKAREKTSQALREKEKTSAKEEKEITTV